MGRLGKQSQGEVLSNHEGRPPPARERSGQLVEDLGNHVAASAQAGIGADMSYIRLFSIRILNLFRRSKLESDLTEQLETHRRMIQDDLIERRSLASCIDRGVGESARH